MSRRSLAGAIAIVVLLLLSLGGLLAGMLRYEPRHHRVAERPPSKERLEQSQDFLKEFTGMIGDIEISKVNTKEQWSQQFTFTDEQINSFLAEGFVQQGLADKLLPEGISEPRVSFEPDLMHLSFRYKTQVMSTVVSIGMKAWVAPSEGNVLALRMEGFHAGAMPFKAQWLLDRLSEVARQHEVEVTWYRHEARPVAILRFQPNQPRPPIKLKQVIVEQGKLTVSGESGGRRTAVSLLPPELFER